MSLTLVAFGLMIAAIVIVVVSIAVGAYVKKWDENDKWPLWSSISIIVFIGFGITTFILGMVSYQDNWNETCSAAGGKVIASACYTQDSEQISIP